MPLYAKNFYTITWYTIVLPICAGLMWFSWFAFYRHGIGPEWYRYTLAVMSSAVVALMCADHTLRFLLEFGAPDKEGTKRK